MDGQQADAPRRQQILRSHDIEGTDQSKRDRTKYPSPRYLSVPRPFCSRLIGSPKIVRVSTHRCDIEVATKRLSVPTERHSHDKELVYPGERYRKDRPSPFDRLFCLVELFSRSWPEAGAQSRTNRSQPPSQIHAGIVLFATR
ncbi:hypothetical protein FALCPG4_014794 [Fusarium falciforme]